MKPSGLLIFEDTRPVQMFCLGLSNSVQEIANTARLSKSILEPRVYQNLMTFQKFN